MMEGESPIEGGSPVDIPMYVDDIFLVQSPSPPRSPPPWEFSPPPPPRPPCKTIPLSEIEKKEFWDQIHEEEFRGQTYIDQRYRPDYSSIPSYLKVRNQADDDMFLQQLNKAQIPRNDPQLVQDHTAVKHAAALKLTDHPYLTDLFYQKLQAANNLPTFDNAIKSSLTMVYKFYTKETLYKSGLPREKQRQMKLLWEHLTMLGREGVSLSEAYEKIAQDVTDEKTYYLVTESDVANLLEYYEDTLCEGYSMYDEVNIVQTKEGVFKHIETVVQKEPLPSKLEEDNCTRLLIDILRGDYFFVASDLVHTLVDQTGGICNLEEDLKDQFKFFLFSLYTDAATEMRYHLVRVIMPVVSLKPAKIIVLSHVYEIIQVAELRRMVLGARFIGRSHLIWAFYECGCGLPSAITKKVNANSADEDRPPYHIYSAAIRLAECLGEKNMSLEHFIFAVLYAEEIGDDLDKMIKFENHFKKFLQDLKRSSENPCSEMTDITPMKKSRIADLSEDDKNISSSFTERSCVVDMVDWD